MKNNDNLKGARTAKNDEFYTRYEDISKEIVNYKKFLKDKVVYCNCDNALHSNFFMYFANQFNILGIKQLICTCYDADSSLALPSWLNVSEDKIPTKAYKVTVNGIADMNGDGIIDGNDVRQLILEALENIDNPNYENEYIKAEYLCVEFLHSDEKYLAGDFRSVECVEILKKADVVVTNPPFSLFREFIALMERYNKKYIVLGNMNAITYKEIFPLIKENKMWAGYSFNKTMEFIMSDDYKLKGKAYIDENGEKHGFVPAICWFTNVDVRKRHELLSFNVFNTYTAEKYPTYDNYDAIEVSEVKNIPVDYDGVMGVPISFLDKYNPEQFEVIGLLNSSTDEMAGIPCNRKYDEFLEVKQDGTYTGASGKKANGNPILNGKSIKGNFFQNKITGEYVYSAYARILIKRKPQKDN